MIGKLLAGLALVGAALFAAPQAQAQRYSGAVFDCSSHGFRYEECNIPFRGDVRIVEQRSGARCVEGETWGTRRGRVWVDKGCSGRFAPDTGGGGGAGLGSHHQLRLRQQPVQLQFLPGRCRSRRHSSFAASDFRYRVYRRSHVGLEPRWRLGRQGLCGRFHDPPPLALIPNSRIFAVQTTTPAFWRAFCLQCSTKPFRIRRPPVAPDTLAQLFWSFSACALTTAVSSTRP